MGVQYRRAKSARVNLTLLSGVIRPEEIMAYYQALDEADPAMADDWITYDRGDADLSELDPGRVAELRAVIAAKVRALVAFRPLRSALVSARTINEPFFQFWKVLVTADQAHPSAPQFFHRLAEAGAWLGLDADARTEVAALAGAGPSA